MQIVISVSDSLYDRLIDMNIDRDTCSFNESTLVEAIQNGTPLPDGAEILTKEAYSDLCRKAADVPDTNVGELISRQAVIEWLKDKDIIKTKNQEENARRELAELPPSKPDRKTGHWEYTQSDYDHNVGNWHCSECKDIVVTCLTRVAEGRIPRYKYCSNCGCRMIEPQEKQESISVPINNNSHSLPIEPPSECR